VRSFPSAAGRRTTAPVALLLTLLTALVCAVAAYAGPLAHADEKDDLEQKKDQVQSQIEQAQHDAEEASKAVDVAEAALARAESDLVTAQGRLGTAQDAAAEATAQLTQAEALDAQMQASLVAAQAALAQAKAELATGQDALAAQQAKVKQTVVDVYQQGSPQLMAITGYLSAQTPADLTRKLEYADNVIHDQGTLFTQLHEAEIALSAKKDAVKAAEVTAAGQADEAAQHLVTVQELKADADAAAAAAYAAQEQVTVTVAAREKAQRKAERARKADLAELEALKKQEERIKQRIIAAAAADTSAGYVGADDGFLLPPVNGTVTSPFGYRIHPIYGYWGLHDGTDFGVSCGEGMRAAAGGKVIEAYYSPVYGNRLYVSVGKVNGHALTVVYNHATSYAVGVGDTVKRGQVVGYVGSTGWSTGCHLHFTVLQDGTAVDPMGYL